jgi:hypothetical protein
MLPNKLQRECAEAARKAASKKKSALPRALIDANRGIWSSKD